MSDFLNISQVARNTVQYKEQELVTLAKEKGTVEEKLNNSNTEKLHNEILQLNLENAKVSRRLISLQSFYLIYHILFKTLKFTIIYRPMCSS